MRLKRDEKRGTNIVPRFFVVALVALLAWRPAAAEPIDLAGIDRVLHFSAVQTARTVARLSLTAQPTTTFPRADGERTAWRSVGAADWTSGFFPGVLWLLYQATGDARWRANASAWTEALADQASRTDTHDLGFMIGSSFGNGYRLTGDARYKAVILQAATSLARRYQPGLGAMETFTGDQWQFAVIVDSMMNLDPWLWGGVNGGDPAWVEMATRHAQLVLANIVRSDGSTFHLADFNPASRMRIRQETYQGFSDTSTWARGQAWAIYGFTTMYQATGNTDFLAAARRTAGVFLAHLPDDFVPYWDFDAPITPTTPRDTSAAAVAASAFAELCQMLPPDDGAVYCTAGRNILGALGAAPYLAPVGSEAILQHASGPDLEADTALIYADYYFLEALLRTRDVLQGRPLWSLYNPAATLP